MGVINLGVPEKETAFLKKTLGLNVFVEGGTYKGDTARKMSDSFEKVFTIEKSDTMFDIANENLDDISNVAILKGDTREHLPAIIENNDKIIFWLDAHWSGGDTYGEEDECPLIEELEIIFEHPKNYVILIDDARLFLAPPPYPHKIQNWPSLKEIINTLPADYDITVFEDVIYIYDVKYNDKIKSFIQKEVTERWKNYRKEKNANFTKRLKMAYSSIRSRWSSH